jgi:protein-disulfide isomerase-like protein with CxxC motif
VSGVPQLLVTRNGRSQLLHGEPLYRGPQGLLALIEQGGREA